MLMEKSFKCQYKDYSNYIIENYQTPVKITLKTNDLGVFAGLTCGFDLIFTRGDKQIYIDDELFQHNQPSDIVEFFANLIKLASDQELPFDYSPRYVSKSDTSI